ncbi:MAG: TetR/AcrR family transcriptional regulator [Stackebrandtia sp.]
MARLTREQSRAQTRQRIIDAAAELFTERGVNGASLEQIAERAGYTRGALYGNFADKHELVLALLTERTRREAEEVRQLGDDFEAAAEQLRAWNRDRATRLREWMALRLELILYALRHPDRAPDVREREEYARRLIERGVTANAPDADASMLALIIHALEDGLLIQHLLAPDAVPADVTVDAVEYLLRLARSNPA